MTRVRKTAPLPWKLSGREWQCMTLWLELGRIKAIARELGLKDKTVTTHITEARKKIKPTGTNVQALVEFDRALRREA